ncbi:hypothetical protein MPSEU_000988700 [Mayamaea pseudoterrestris]|nr:hypothetical protein MPSEU_000988700 [Mayamaea pseudoterrestris]
MNYSEQQHDESDSDAGAASSSDDDVENDCLNRKIARRQRQQMEDLYGSFLDSDDEGGNTFRKFNQHRSSNSDGNSRKHGAPVFVKTSRAEEDVAEIESKPVLPTQTQAATESAANELQDDNQPDEDELKRRREMEEKNQRFLELLQKGKGLKRAPASRSNHGASLRESVREAKVDAPSMEPATLLNSPSTGGLGLGATASVPMQFGGTNSRGLSKPPAAAIPKPATWEKHTKGIGSKLLAKMGYSGQGGLNKRLRTMNTTEELQQPDAAAAIATPSAANGTVETKGISQPVQVKVRPSGLGLGFGNFKEASSLSQNKQIEAQVRGIDVIDDKPANAASRQASASSGRSGGASSSALPSVKDLLSEQSWRRGAKGSKKRKRTVVPYTELLKQQPANKQVIIDMRGPAFDDSGEDHDANGQAQLGVELLHNVSLLLNTYENKLYSQSTFVDSSKRKLASIESDVQSMEERRSGTQERIQKLERTRSILAMIGQLSNPASVNPDTVMEKVRLLLTELGDTFTAQEKIDLNFSEVLVPALLASVVDSSFLENWNPLKDPLQRSKIIISSVVGVVMSPDHANSMEAAQNLLTSSLLPKIRAALASVRWDPVRDMDSALDLYEILIERLAEIDETLQQQVSDEINVLPGSVNSPQLVEIAKEVLIRDVVFQKLSTALGRWKPELDDASRLKDRIDLWVIPWLPHLDHEGLLPQLVSECKRKVKASITFLQKEIKDDGDFIAAVIETLRSWKGVLKEKTLHDIVSTDVCPRLARTFCSTKAMVASLSADWSVVELVFQLNDSRLLSDIEFLALMEGDILLPWYDAIYDWLSKGGHIDNAVESYLDMKTRLFQCAGFDCHCPGASRRLYEDETICRVFYSLLLMFRALVDARQADISVYSSGHFRSTFRSALVRRTKEEQRRIADELARMDGGVVGESDLGMDTRLRMNRSGQTPTFKEVVEEFANERSILFQPKQGSNATRDGKPVYVFGKVPIYFDADVVFALNDGEWVPTPLQKLVDRAN